MKKLIALVLAMLLVLGCCAAFAEGDGITLDVPFDMVVMQITAAITAPLPAWAIGSILILGVVWVLGIGLAFWPRFSMLSLYYHCLVMRGTDVM